jgi:hypothetical protein
VIHLRRSSRIEAALRQGRTLPAGPVATLSDALRRGLDALPRRDVDPSPVLGGVR